MPDDNYERDPRHAYLEWLHMEARLLRMELFPEMDPSLRFTPCGTFARYFHFPAGGSWRDVPPPSTRANVVMRAVGIEVPEVAA